MLSRYTVLFSSIAACAMLSLTPTAHAQTRYRATALPDLANEFGAYSEAHAINDRGDVVGESRGPGGSLGAVIWRDGRVIQISSQPSNARGVNNRGAVVGGFFGLQFVWCHGSLRRLEDLPGGDVNSSVVDINNRGQIVGSGCSDEGCPAVLWEHLQPIALPDLPGGLVYGQAMAINDRGEIVGGSSGEGVTLQATLWQGGVVMALDEPGSIAIDINNQGQIVGTTFGRPALWQEHERTDLPLPARFVSGQARSINERGVIVGWAETAPPFDIRRHAMIWRDGSVVNLNDVVENLPASIELTSAEGINERGQIAVTAIDTSMPPASQARAFLLVPFRR